MRKRNKKNKPIKLFQYKNELYVQITEGETKNLDFMCQYYNEMLLVTIEQYFKHFICDKVDYTIWIDDDMFAIYFKPITPKFTTFQRINRIFGITSIHAVGNDLCVTINPTKFIEVIE